MTSIFQAISNNTKEIFSSSSNSRNSTSTEDISVTYKDDNDHIDHTKMKIRKDDDDHDSDRKIKALKNITRKQQKDTDTNGSKRTCNDKNDIGGESNVGGNTGMISPTTVTYLKAEYRILNITTHLKEMTERYDYTPMPFDPLSSCSLDVQSCRFSPSITPMSTISSQETWSEREGEGIEDDNDRVRREIEEEMYKQLCGLYDIIKMESVLEQYVLRELRHLQEYLCHKYPPIMAYLRVPFDEIIECARGKTKGLNITCPDSKNRPVSVQRLSAPSPMKIASPSGSSSALSPQTATSSASNTSRGTNRERSIVSTSSSISSMPSKKQNKSNTVDDLSTSSGPDSSEEERCYDEI